ncbi:MFS transporter [Goodfellowiella coeruleoviolacea]|uniref:MFS transporter, CP family, cyanate transporter n=1 Tax=Goodfellowiella coeruleoviolacea TaxID=334858 RepID=A0AAE3GKC0_9PSEU|nr:MFS transporter [Goodfellowiella coeruleoviolacea]MCP2169781.1 MFS transporter, CP family, cyanate transporter [Goodfellowiella coeruleoviolacea]
MPNDDLVVAPPERVARAGGRSAGWVRALAAVALVLAAVNLRPAVTSLGPVLEEARAGLGMSATVAGLLTSVPALCFALVGATAPGLARRFGSGGVVAAGMAAITVGLALRPLLPDTAGFLGLTALALAGIAVANVLLPVVVKQRFPDRVGAMTGAYSMALNLGASTAAAVTVPLAGVFGGDWRIGLGAWAVLAAVAVPPWLVLAGHRRHERAGTAAPPAAPTAGAPTAGAPAAGAPAAAAPQRITRSPTAWALAVYFGLQATAAYVIMGWLPQVFRDAGLPAQTAGLLFAVTSLLGVPLSFALAAVAGRLSSQSGIAVVIGVVGLAGYAGLWAAPAAAPWLWAVLLGVANCSFPLALTMIGMRGRDSATVIRLSAFAQSAGYLLSIPGPILVGALYQHSGGWRAPLVLLALLMLPQLVAGVLAGRDRQIG